MSKEKNQRNKEITKKRRLDPKKWGYGTLAKHYGISRFTVRDIVKRDLTS